MSAPVRIDLHRHLEGSLRPAHLAEVLARRGELDPGFRRAITVSGGVAADLVDYLGRIDTATAVLRDVADWETAARHAVEDAYDDGLDYLELRYSPWFVSSQTGLDPRAVAEAIAAGVREASARTIPVGLIGIVVRNFGAESAEAQMDVVLETAGDWCGVDLAGDEAGYPAADFAPAFRRARDAGLHVTIHAGEAAGPESVIAAIDELGAERIGHGVRSAEDPRLLERLAERGTTLEVALTSNTQTRASRSIAEHQVRALLDAGVRAALSTDNPTTSGTRLSEEYRRAASEAGLDETQLATLARNAALGSFTEAGRAFADV